VPVSSVQYFTGGQEDPGRIEKAAVKLPPEIKIESIPGDKTLSKMLEAGEIDALYAPRAPSTLHSGSGKVRRLFPDYQHVEREYYLKTKIFPPMHVIAIRREVYEKNRWVAQSLYKAFVVAQREVYEDMHQVGALKFMLPWLIPHVEETERLLGRDFWPYGYEPNVHPLRTFLRYSYEQGLSKRQLEPKELFAPESLESFKI
jgi:4,5-dihydroxyphthalate decarboxylase